MHFLKLGLYGIFFFLIIIPFSNAQQFEGNKKEINKILSAIKDFSQFYMDADYELLANAYAPDGSILPPGADIIKGRAAIKERWILPEGVKILHHQVDPVEIKIIDDYAYDIGYYEGKTKKKDGSEVEWKGKYLIVWKKVEGQWKIYSDAWSRID